MSTTSQIERQKMRDYEAETVRLQSCQAKLSGKDGDICGEGSEYCKKCSYCGTPVCDEHGLFIDGDWFCFADAKIEFDAIDLIDAEDSEDKGKVAA